jgi:hypothetical protein
VKNKPSPHRRSLEERRRRPLADIEPADARTDWILAIVYTSLGVLLVPLGIVVTVAWTLAAIRGLRAATTPAERIYWKFSIASHLLFAYASFVLTALAADSLLGEPWNLAASWPSIFRYLDVSANGIVIILLEVLMVLALATAAICLSRCFGYVDEHELWRPTAWVRKRNVSLYGERRRPGRRRRTEIEKRNGRSR